MLIGSLIANDIALTPGHCLLLLMAVLTGAAICAGVFVAAAGVQFFLIDAAEMTNSIVYGGRYAATQPGSVWNRPLIAVFASPYPWPSPVTCPR